VAPPAWLPPNWLYCNDLNHQNTRSCQPVPDQSAGPEGAAGHMDLGDARNSYCRSRFLEFVVVVVVAPATPGFRFQVQSPLSPTLSSSGAIADASPLLPVPRLASPAQRQRHQRSCVLHFSCCRSRASFQPDVSLNQHFDDIGLQIMPEEAQLGPEFFVRKPLAAGSFA
jgi:hypothetical protein